MFAGVDGMKIIGQNPETPGAFGEYLLLDETLLQVVRSDLPSEAVCVSDAVGVGWSAARRAQVGAREVPLVIGCGAIALAVIGTLKRLGPARSWRPTSSPRAGRWRSPWALTW